MSEITTDPARQAELIALNRAVAERVFGGKRTEYDDTYETPWERWEFPVTEAFPYTALSQHGSPDFAGDDAYMGRLMRWFNLRKYQVQTNRSTMHNPHTFQDGIWLEGSATAKPYVGGVGISVFAADVPEALCLLALQVLDAEAAQEAGQNQ